MEQTKLIQEQQAEYSEYRNIKADGNEFIRAKQNVNISSFVVNNRRLMCYPPVLIVLNRNTIVGNMDSRILLGGKELTTLKELNRALGKEKIDTCNTGESRGREQPTA